MSKQSGRRSIALSSRLPGGRLLLVGLASFVLLGCSPTAQPATTPGSTPTLSIAPSASASPPPAASPFADELQNVKPDGSRTVESALRLFALAYGPLPGVDAPPSATTAPSGTVAIRAVQAHWSELSPAQQQAITDRLAVPANAPIVKPPALPTTTIAARLAVAHDVHPVVELIPAAVAPDVQQAILGVVNDMTARIEAKLGTNLPGEIRLVISDVQNGVYGDSDPTYRGGGYDSCTVRLFGAATTGEPITLTNTVAHEVFHCFEAAYVPSEARWLAINDAWIEGASAWVGDALGAPDANMTAYWKRYLTDPRIGLLSRTYDAVGFFAHLDETGTSPWTVFPGIFGAIGDAAAFTASGATSDRFLDSWASGVLRDPGRGIAWDTTAPGITDDRTVPQPLPIGEGKEIEVAVTAYSGGLYQVQASADLLEVAIFGHARLSDDTIDTTRLQTDLFCTKAGGCPETCPDGSPWPEKPVALGPSAVLALSAGLQGTSGTLTGTSIDAYCKKPSPPPAAKAVRLHMDPFGMRIDAVSCTGPFGSWSGILRAGSIPGSTSRGDLPDPKQPYLDLPIAFTVSGTSGHATVRGQKTIGGVPWTFTFDLTFTVAPSGDRVSVDGSQTVQIAALPTREKLSYPDQPITAAPAGRCP